MYLNILITGANGFVGKALTKALLNAGYFVRGAVRALPQHPFIEHENFELIAAGEINSQTNWSEALKSIDIVIHTAARVHMMNETALDPFTEYREVNTAGTLKLVEDSIEAGIKKIIFISSIKVNGEETIDKPFTESDFCSPDDPYGLSKWEAEQGIIQKAFGRNISYTIIRLPLVYGDGVKANFQKLVQLVKSNIPLPLGAIKNKRSFLYIGNLSSAIFEIIRNPASHNKTYLLSDNDDVSTAELIRKIAKAYGVKRYLLPVPLFLFKLLGKITGKQKAITRLLGSLQVDSSKVRQELNWTPPYTVQTGLVEMAGQEKSYIRK